MLLLLLLLGASRAACATPARMALLLLPAACELDSPHTPAPLPAPAAAGTNGCSQKPLAVLKSEVPTNNNAFMSPDVYTLVLTDSTKALVRTASRLLDALPQARSCPPPPFWQLEPTPAIRAARLPAAAQGLPVCRPG